MRKQGLMENGDARFFWSGEFADSLLGRPEALVGKQLSSS
jgi:hypothetical protein